MHLHLAPGETLLDGAEVALEKVFADAEVFAALVPIVPRGAGRVPRAAARLMRAWDARFLHDQTWFAMGARVAFRSESEDEDAAAHGRVGGREPLASWRAADAAPALARALDAGRRVVALPTGVASPVGADLDAWLAWWREEGAAWGALAAREPRFLAQMPARGWRGWARHNVAQVSRRVGEAAQALRQSDGFAVYLHVAREAVWTGAAVRAYAGRGRGRGPGR